MSSAIYKNSTILLASEAFSAVLAALTTVLVARHVSVSEFGRFMAAFSFAQILAMLVDGGMGQMMARTIARGSSEALKELSQALKWRLAMIAVVCLFAIPLGRLTHFFDPTSLLAIALTPGVMLFMVIDFCCWIFKGAREVVWCAVAQLGSRVFLFVSCLVALRGAHPMQGLVTAQYLSGVVVAVSGLYLLSQTLGKVNLLIRLDRTFFKDVLPTIYKVGGIMVIGFMFPRIDLIIVPRICGPEQAGLYSSAARVLEGVRVLATVAYSIYLPLFSSMHDKPEELRRHYQGASLLLTILAVALALGAHAWGEVLFVRLWGDRYRAGAHYFEPLAWSSAFMFCNILMLAFLYSQNNHRFPAIAVVLVLVTNVVLNLWLLPRWGAMAASWNRLIAEGVGFAVQVVGLARTRFLSASDALVSPAAILGLCLLALLLSHPMSLIVQSLAGSVVLLLAGWMLWFRHDDEGAA